MPDLLVHALIAYVVCVLLSRRLRWITPPYVTVGMMGAFLPDFSKASLLISSWGVSQLLGVPFSWRVLHLASGVLVTALIGATVVHAAHRRRVLGLLLLGAGTHLCADALLITATGRTVPFLWPLVAYAPPTPGLYTSTDPAVTLAAIVLAAVTYPFAGYREATER